MSKVAIVGVEGSGKTVLMAALAEMYGQASQHSIYLMPENQAAFSFMTMIPHKMRVERQWPEATAIQSMKFLKWTVRIGQEILAELEMLDYPGELYRLAFGERKEEEIEGNKAQVHEFLEHLVTADDLIVLFNLKDALDIGTNARNNETVWLTRGIFDYARKLPNIKNQLLLFTQADRYRQILENEGGPKAMQGKYLPMLSILHPNLECGAISAFESAGADQAAPVAVANGGISELMRRIVLSSEIGQQAIEWHKNCKQAANKALQVHATMAELEDAIVSFRAAHDKTGNIEKGVAELCFPGSFAELDKQRDVVTAFWAGIQAIVNANRATTLSDKTAWNILIEKYQGEASFLATIENLIREFAALAKEEELERKARKREKKIRRACIVVGAAVGACLIAYFAAWHSHQNIIIAQLESDTELDRSVCQLALKNKPDAQRQVGLAYIEYGHGSSNMAQAYTWLMRAADQGDARAQNILGVMYLEGRGVAKDEAEAVKWFRLAADQGDADAQNSLGVMYLNGRGVEKDEAESARWFRKAADQGDVFAQITLGNAYSEGRGVAKNDSEAMKWFRKAADQGNVLAQITLGVAYTKGQGVAENDSEAVKWFRKAADQGDVFAQTMLGIAYSVGWGVAKNDSEAVKWFRKAADQGDAKAQLSLGEMYAVGRGVAKDEAEAVKWFRLAADQGDADSQRKLGLMYQEGLGVAKDDAEAAKWFRMAAGNGDTRAQANQSGIVNHGHAATKAKTDPPVAP